MEPDVTARITAFLNRIGLPVEKAELTAPTFLPGIRLDAGRLLVDQSKLLYPGDLLHEAGHLALAPPHLRALMSDSLDVSELNEASLEVGAIAWSYAAALFLELDPRVVFHKDGYLGGSERLLLSFAMGVYPGLPALVAAGLTLFGDRAREQCLAPFPHMIQWLRY